MTLVSSKQNGVPNWAECATTDLSAAEAFYAAVLNWIPERAPASDGAAYSIQRLNGKRVAGIYEIDAELRTERQSRWETYFAVEDVDATLEKMIGAGGEVLEDLSNKAGAGGVVIRDNVGAVLKVRLSTPENSAEAFNTPGAMAWNELCTNDPERAAVFYQKAFGLTATRLEGATPYTVLMADGREVAGILQITPDMGDMSSTWDVYFACRDVDATVKSAVAAGGKVLKEPFEIAGGGARLAVLQDPQGAVFEVIDMKDAGQ